MAIETFGFIDDLNVANPTATDNVSEGDDHIRGVKATLKSTFPNVTGAITPTATELNYVDGVTSSIQDQLDNIDTDLLNDTTPQLGGNLDTQSFTVDGRDVSTDGTKLDGIEASATADQTQSDINALGITAVSVDLGNWTITESGGVAYFATSGTNKMKLDASGNITAVGDITAFGTI